MKTLITTVLILFTTVSGFAQNRFDIFIKAVSEKVVDVIARRLRRFVRNILAMHAQNLPTP